MIVFLCVVCEECTVYCFCRVGRRSVIFSVVCVKMMVLFTFYDIHFLGIEQYEKNKGVETKLGTHYVLFQSVRYVLFHSKKERWVLFRSFYNGNFFGNYENSFMYIQCRFHQVQVGSFLLLPTLPPYYQVLQKILMCF